jgi:hypothetical protein
MDEYNEQKDAPRIGAGFEYQRHCSYFLRRIVGAARVFPINKQV